MTALQVLHLLKSTRDSASPALLWLDHGRHNAAVHDGQIAHRVAFNDALIARGDPSLRILEHRGGELISA